jgi:hypothetical protein
MSAFAIWRKARIPPSYIGATAECESASDDYLAVEARARIGLIQAGFAADDEQAGALSDRLFAFLFRIRGPGYTNWDGAVIRSFPIFRESNPQFRAEYFDLLNHT